MITSSIESNNLHVKQIQGIEVNHVAEVPPSAIWLRHLQKTVYSPLDQADSDDISGSDVENRLMTAASIRQGLNRTLLSLLDNHNTSSLIYLPHNKHRNQNKKPFNVSFCILDNDNTLHMCWNVSTSQITVSIWTCPHPEKHCISSCWLMISPPCGPSATNNMNCLHVRLTRHHWNCCCIVPNEICIVETTEILMVIDVICEIGKSLNNQAMRICCSLSGIAHHLAKSSKVLISGHRFFISSLIGA